MFTAQDIRSFDGKKVHITFTDSCSMDLKIISTMHLDEGDDFVADALGIHCDDEKHYHPEVGTALNIRVEDVAAITGLERG